MVKKVRLDETEYSSGLVATYENVARKIGYPVSDHTRFDCRHICVASNVQDKWITYYSDRTRAKHPDLAERDITANVMALLLFSGAKVDQALAPSEVTVEGGFVSEGGTD